MTLLGAQASFLVTVAIGSHDLLLSSPELVLAQRQQALRPARSYHGNHCAYPRHGRLQHGKCRDCRRAWPRSLISHGEV